MNNIVNNFLDSVINNQITIGFLLIIFMYSIYKIIENITLFNYINKFINEVSENQKRSLFYAKVLNKYNNYINENPYANVSVTSIIEEIVSELKYRNKYILEKIKTLKNASSISILLGVLGTFVGLSMMLLTVNTDDIINSLPATISSMQTAFATSIFGIIFSLIMGVMIRIKDCENSLLQLMLKLENLLTADVTNKNNKRVDERAEELRNTINNINNSIASLGRFDKISKDLNEFNEEFISGIESLKFLLDGSQDSINTFEQSIRLLDKQFNILNIKFDDIFDKYESQEEINREVLKEIKETTKHIYESTNSNDEVKSYIQSINSILKNHEENVDNIISNISTNEDKMNISQSNLYEQRVELDNCIKNLSNVILMSSNDIQNKLDMVFSYIDIYNEALKVSSNNTCIQETINTNPDEKFINEEIYEIDNEQELNNKNKKTFTVIKSISEDDFNDR